MTTGIVFDPDRARDFVAGWNLWPLTERAENTAAQDWWLRVLERVVWSVNEIDWNDEAYPDDKYTEIVETAVAQWVSQARKERRVLSLCELSGVHQELDDPFDDDIYLRITSAVVEPEKFEERQEAARQRLTLKEIGEAYLDAAACQVARDWCHNLVEDWREANPEPTEDDDEEEV